MTKSKLLTNQISVDVSENQSKFESFDANSAIFKIFAKNWSWSFLIKRLGPMVHLPPDPDVTV